MGLGVEKLPMRMLCMISGICVDGGGSGRRGGGVSESARWVTERAAIDSGSVCWDIFERVFARASTGTVGGVGGRCGGRARTPRVPSTDCAPPDSSELPAGWLPSKCGVMYTGEGDPTPRAPCASSPMAPIAFPCAPSAADPSSPASSPAMAKPTVRLMGWGRPGVPRMSIPRRR